jgi:hypothetical protein
MNDPPNVNQWIDTKWCFKTILELLFIHNLNIPWLTSNCHNQAKVKLHNLTYQTLTSLVHSTMPSTFLMFGKLASHSSCSQHCEYTIPMASREAHRRNQLSNSLINWVTTPMDLQNQNFKKKHMCLKLQNSQHIKIMYIQMVSNLLEHFNFALEKKLESQLFALLKLGHCAQPEAFHCSQ